MLRLLELGIYNMLNRFDKAVLTRLVFFIKGVYEFVTRTNNTYRVFKRGECNYVIQHWKLFLWWQHTRPGEDFVVRVFLDSASAERFIKNEIADEVNERRWRKTKPNRNAMSVIDLNKEVP